jgi:hypothetical protein
MVRFGSDDLRFLDRFLGGSSRGRGCGRLLDQILLGD